MEREITFFTEDISFDVPNEQLLKEWIQSVIEKFDFKLIGVNYILCSDEYLHKINVEYLDHDTYTDIITFDNSEYENEIESDIFVSIDRIRENSKAIGTNEIDEFHRVLIHGILHLLGFKDKSNEDAKKMRNLEDEQLAFRNDSLKA
ncbi:rRNA maturation RNase YbeY [Flammeovirga kamogawensis]|uniref:Endoribonuclease YbeY n=1 Tax=Flammeovirga kamogawensis TaxID=373891 RepID=A0ABX8GSN2_9BACT|nr:rRNA maturation RNase YbeY [Flammeovirga kamogawensis]MBB6463811.1 rRNA maturation RNase YbeY [Flammeovirga kamogawensis]QWG06172.1 rRNA maturation RNase YbeY [Flammeovirga kamogawensis]TRX68003.1 rRNA maturation RNase YbeY [Flammeovirga kamogawensis]